MNEIQLNAAILEFKRKFNIEKSIEGTLAYKLNEDIQKGLSEKEILENFEKSFSSDLQSKFPNGGWRTVNGAKVFINNGKVVAGLGGFNKEIDKFFEGKKGKKGKEGEKKDNNKYTSENFKDDLRSILGNRMSAGSISEKDGIHVVWGKNKEYKDWEKIRVFDESEDNHKVKVFDADNKGMFDVVEYVKSKKDSKPKQEEKKDSDSKQETFRDKIMNANVDIEEKFNMLNDYQRKYNLSENAKKNLDKIREDLVILREKEKNKIKQSKEKKETSKPEVSQDKKKIVKEIANLTVQARELNKKQIYDPKTFEINKDTLKDMIDVSSQIDEKILSKETRDKIDDIKEDLDNFVTKDIYVQMSSGRKGKFLNTDKDFESNLKDKKTLSDKLKFIVGEYEKEDGEGNSQIVGIDEHFEKVKDLLVDITREHSNKKVTEALNYKLF